MSDEEKGTNMDDYRTEEEMGGEEDYDPPPPPPPEDDKELIFLIEFLVDSLSLFPKNMKTENIDPCALQGPSNLILTFLHFPPMLISEKDLGEDHPMGNNEVQFNSGKSLMFALTESQFEDPPPVFLMVTAAKEMPHAFRFRELLIGKTKIELSELFKQVFDKYDKNPDKVVSKSVKDKFELIGEKNKPGGEVSIYIRLTCLGENIVTEFQKAEESGEPLLFKNKESKKVYECVVTEQPDETEGRLLPGWGPDKKKGCEEALLGKPPDPDDENFEEIYAEINGSAIIVKVEKSKRKEPPKQYHVSDFCDCNIPLPQTLVAGLSDLSLSPASQSSVNLRTGNTVKTDPRVGIDPRNHLLFKVPSLGTLAQPGLQNTIAYNVSTCHEGEKHGHDAKNSFRVLTDNNIEGPPPSVPNDPEKDVFILRIIKRGRKDKGKEILDLEFKTPKEKIEPPKRPPYMVETGVGPEKKKKKKDKKRKKK